MSEEDLSIINITYNINEEAKEYKYINILTLNFRK